MKIIYDKWEEFADIKWEGQETIPPDKSIVYVPMDWIYEFFKLISETNNKYVVLSANSDYGLVEQKDNPVNLDMRKYFSMIDVSNIGYNSIQVQQRCDSAFCKIDDKFSIKMYSYTKRTFNKIPDNVVKWFSTNNNIDDKRIIHIPFGVSNDTKDFLEKTVKDKFSIYINFQPNTLERLNIMNSFLNLPDVIVETNVSHSKFVDRLKECPFVFSLPGNGFDCYRTLESLYCGSIPIIVDDIWSVAYNNMPCIKVNSYFEAYDQLKVFWKSIGEKLDLPLDETALDMLEWKKLILAAKEEMISNV